MLRIPRILIALFVALVFTCVAGTAYAQEDLTPPVLISVSFEPPSIDTSAGPATIIMTVVVTDDLSGVWQGGIQLYNERTDRRYTIPFFDNSSNRPYLPPDTYVAEATFPQYTPYGSYSMELYFVRDYVGNSTSVRKPVTDAAKRAAGAQWPSIFNGVSLAVISDGAPRNLYLPSLAH